MPAGAVARNSVPYCAQVFLIGPDGKILARDFREPSWIVRGVADALPPAR